MTNIELTQWLKERNEAVSTLDVQTFKKFYNKWLMRGIYDFSLPCNETLVELTMYKMAVNIVSIPCEVKRKAKAWLIEHGYSFYV